MVVLPVSAVGAVETEPQPSPHGGVLTIDATSEPARHIRLVPARRTKTAGNIVATATVEPDADAVAQITTRIPAQVTKLIAEAGQTVTQGQPLAMLSSIELGDAKAEYLKTRSLETIAAQNLKREQDLYTKQISSLKDVLAARAAHDVALAQYQAAREKLTLLIPPIELAHLNWSSNGRPLSEFSVSSPVAGTLVRRDVVLGEAVASDRPLMTVINLDKVWVNTSVYESDLAAVKIGDRATVKVVVYPDRSFEGRVFYIGDEIDRKTRTALARIEVPNPDHLLKPGMFATSVIEGSGGSREAIVVPESAVFDYQDGKVVFTAVGPNRYQARSIEVGGTTEGGVEVLAGLSEGEQVVTKGGLALKGLLINQGSK
jgi:cobalt-zinc-cadmium efflux system membrane fusion protein